MKVLYLYAGVGIHIVYMCMGCVWFLWRSVVYVLYEYMHMYGVGHGICVVLMCACLSLCAIHTMCVSLCICV